MIFVTTGTQLAFPRLISAMDGIAERLNERIVAQIGPDPGPYPNLETRTSLSPAAFKALFSDARVVVAHAGIGTVLSAQKCEKPLILMPRRHDLSEHRNDHQMATVAALRGRRGLYVAENETELEDVLCSGALAPMQDIAGPEAVLLTNFVRKWLARL